MISGSSVSRSSRWVRSLSDRNSRVVGSGDGARLCSGYNAGASEPCVEPSLKLAGAPAASGTQISLLGTVEGDTFVVSSAVQG